MCDMESILLMSQGFTPKVSITVSGEVIELTFKGSVLFQMDNLENGIYLVGASGVGLMTVYEGQRIHPENGYTWVCNHK